MMMADTDVDVLLDCCVDLVIHECSQTLPNPTSLHEILHTQLFLS